MLVCSLISVLVYYAACGDHALGIRAKGICNEKAAKPLLAVSAALFFVQLLLIATHLVFYFLGRLSVRLPSTKAN
jgi:hypothetical protein